MSERRLPYFFSDIYWVNVWIRREAENSRGEQHDVYIVRYFEDYYPYFFIGRVASRVVKDGVTGWNVLYEDTVTTDGNNNLFCTSTVQSIALQDSLAIVVADIEGAPGRLVLVATVPPDAINQPVLQKPLDKALTVNHFRSQVDLLPVQRSHLRHVPEWWSHHRCREVPHRRGVLRLPGRKCFTCMDFVNRCVDGIHRRGCYERH